MEIRRIAIALVAMAGLGGLAACSGADADTAAPKSSAAPAAKANDGAGSSIKVSSVVGKDVLTDGEGRSLYVFTKDEENKSNCVDDCLQTWPALTAPATPGDKVDDSLVGSINRQDGGSQATYAGKPLYYFAEDKKPGDANGQGVKDVWFLADATGAAVPADSEGAEEPSDEAEQTGTVVQQGLLAGKQALTDGAGRALYAFAKDTANTSNCLDDVCRETWPVLTGPATAGENVVADQLGTITREDGTVQVTYFGKPLYYHVQDQAPGDTLGNGFKGQWCLVDVNGQTISE